ncbi:hypothetical protein ACE6H2_016375 [Prunus campanulata]
MELKTEPCISLGTLLCYLFVADIHDIVSVAVEILVNYHILTCRTHNMVLLA